MEVVLRKPLCLGQMIVDIPKAKLIELETRCAQIPQVAQDLITRLVSFDCRQRIHLEPLRKMMEIIYGYSEGKSFVPISSCLRIAIGKSIKKNYRIRPHPSIGEYGSKHLIFKFDALDCVKTLFGKCGPCGRGGGVRARRVRTSNWIDLVQSGRACGCHASFSGLQ